MTPHIPTPEQALAARAISVDEARQSRQARIDARTLELIEEASGEGSLYSANFRVWGAAEAACRRRRASPMLRAALTEARRIATEEADADTTTTGGT